MPNAPTTVQPAARALALAFGLVMVELAGLGSQGPALAVAAAAVVAVGVGMVFRPAATLAVLLTVCTIGLSNPPPLPVALSGLSAAAYLLCRYAVGTPVGAVLGNWPTIVGAVGFTFAGLVAAMFPLQLPWLPLVAPLGVLAIYVLATRPFLG
jgi:hypothetical protein